MISKILIFDTETTGLPLRGAKWNENPELFPEIVQLSWKWLGEEEIQDRIITPESFVSIDHIPDGAAKVHGITTEEALQKGELFDTVMGEFTLDASKADFIVGHNVYFDSSIVKANAAKRYGNACLTRTVDNSLSKDKRICTMMKTVKLCGIPQLGGRGLKFPTLEELYARLFNGETFPAHNAKEDVLATERCFIELTRLGVI